MANQTRISASGFILGRKHPSAHLQPLAHKALFKRRSSDWPFSGGRELVHWPTIVFAQ